MHDDQCSFVAQLAYIIRLKSKPNCRICSLQHRCCELDVVNFTVHCKMFYIVLIFLHVKLKFQIKETYKSLDNYLKNVLTGKLSISRPLAVLEHRFGFTISNRMEILLLWKPPKRTAARTFLQQVHRPGLHEESDLIN